MELYFSFFFKLLVVNINNFLHENNFFALGRSISYRRVFAMYLIPSLENIYIPHKLLGCTRVRASHVELHPRVLYVRAHAVTGQRTGCNARKSGAGCERVEQRGGVRSKRMKASCKRSIEPGEFCRGNDDSKKDEKVRMVDGGRARKMD